MSSFVTSDARLTNGVQFLYDRELHLRCESSDHVMAAILEITVCQYWKTAARMARTIADAECSRMA